MTQKAMISIWFWVGLVLGVYGLMLIAAGVYYVFVPEAALATVVYDKPVLDEDKAQQQRQQAGDATRAEAIRRNAVAAERLALSTLQLRQAVNDPTVAARLEQVATTLKSISGELQEESDQMLRPPEELRVMVGEVGGNTTLWWGFVMLIAGGIFLFIGRRDKSLGY